MKHSPTPTSAGLQQQSVDGTRQRALDALARGEKIRNALASAAVSARELAEAHQKRLSAELPKMAAAVETAGDEDGRQEASAAYLRARQQQQALEQGWQLARRQELESN